MGCKQDILCDKRIIIGIKDFAQCAKPESGLFINDIPGITLKNAAAIVNEEQQSGFELLKIIIKNAILYSFQDFNNRISPSFKYNAIAEIRKINYFDGSILPKANANRGIVLKRWRSEMAEIYISDIYVKSQNSGVAIIRIYDGDKLVKTIEADLIANEEKTFRVDFQAEAETVKILCDDTNFAMYSGQIDRRFTGCNSCNGNSGQDFYITGWDGSREIPIYYGIGVNASVRCEEENIICLLLKKMNFIFWYKAGALYYEELLNSTRLNAITLYSKDRAQINLDILNEKYEKAFNDFRPTIEAMLKSTKGECITCNPQIKYVQTTP